MIFLVVIFIVIMIAFSEIGLAALVVLPAIVAMLVAIVTFFAMLAGVPGAGGTFVASALIVVVFFGALNLLGRS